MLKKHPYVACQFPDNATIWKYFPFPAFLTLLENRELYFTRVSTLDDPNEYPITERDANYFSLSLERYTDAVNRTKEKSFVNCWRLSEYESFGMWSAYADSATGIAVKSDVERLFAAFDENDERVVTAGKVAYIDTLSEMAQNPADRPNVFYIACAKTKPYENEKELRLCYEDSHRVIQDNYVGFPINITTLIKEIYVGSSAKPYVKDLIENVLRKHGIYVNVTQSIVK